MPEEFKSEHAVKDLMLCNLVALAMWGLCIYVGIGFAAIGVFLIPAAYIYITAKYGFKLGIPSLLVFCAVACITKDVRLGLLVSMALACAVLPVGYALNKKMDMYKAYGLSFTGVAVGVFAFVLLIQAFYGVTLNELIVQNLETSMASDEQGTRLLYVMSNYLLTGVADLKSLTQSTLSLDYMISAVTRNYREILALVMPMLLSSLSAVVGAANILIIGNILQKTKPPKYEMKPFSELMMPSAFGTFVIAFLLLAWFGIIFSWNNFDIVYAIVNGFATVMFTMQGMALVDWLLKKKINMLGLRWVIIIVSFIFLSVINLYMWIGLFEQVIRIRQRSAALEE